MLQLFLLINACHSACCTFTRLNLTLGTAHRYSGFEDLQSFLQRLDFLLSGCFSVGARDTRVNTSVCTPISFVCPESSSCSELSPRGLVVSVFVQILLVDLHSRELHRMVSFVSSSSSTCSIARLGSFVFSVNLTMFRIVVHSQLLNFLAQLRVESLLNSCMSSALSI